MIGIRPFASRVIAGAMVLSAASCWGAEKNWAGQNWGRNAVGRTTAGESPVIRVTPVAENIVRVQITPKGVQPDTNKFSALVAPPTAFAGACRIKAHVENGIIRFSDASGGVFLTQATEAFKKNKVGDAEFRSVSVGWQSGAPDGLYGLGSSQDGDLDLRGHELACYQKNLEDTVPMLVSTAGFGILWDNAAPFTFKADAKDGGFSLTAPTGGEADYYVIADAGPNAVIAGYRKLTGAAPLFPKWAFGYHQSKERYRSQAEILAIASKFRDLKFPLDLIIQDWQYWGAHGWNACQFDTARYPDAKGMIGKLHADHIHYITSVWPSFGNGPKGSAVFRELTAMGALSKGAACMGPHYYDAFNDAARAVVWQNAKKGLFDPGVDGWWLDSSEPEVDGGNRTVDDVFKFGATCAKGPFPAIANAYPFFVVKAFHDGQRSTDGGKRFFALTRSAYAGIQRLGISYWTGDTHSTWDSFRRQISACLGMSAAGIPYVNSDIGGFFSGPSTELAVRWFQFGAFCGEFRMHGTGAPREPWRYGNPGAAAYDTMLDFAKLRYHLLPYIYSIAWQVTSAGASLMCALPLDFPKDAAVRDCSDEFMFGPSLLVAPVTEPCKPAKNAGEAGTTAPRMVTLPSGVDWYDFWTGAKSAGGQVMRMNVPLVSMPLFVRAGSIVPFGPALQYTGEKSDLPVELRIYPGRDAAFTLYDDAGDGYGYENGPRATISLSWSDTAQTLIIGRREGTYPGMDVKRKFTVRLLQDDRSWKDVPVVYDGSRQSVKP